MNFNKKSLLASVGILAGVLAPVSTVFAAQGYDENGQEQGLSGTPAVPKGYNSDANATILPVYTAGTSNATSGSAAAYSVATVTIKNGFLQLNAVPDLHFTNSFAGGTANLDVSNPNSKGNYGGTEFTDGNNQGILQVADSRSGATTGTNAQPSARNGWKLTLDLGQFKSTDNASEKYSSGAREAAAGWTLNLNRGLAAQTAQTSHVGPFDLLQGTSLTGTDANGAPNGSKTTDSVVSVGAEDLSTATAASATPIWVAAANQGVGRTTAFYKDAASASLSIPTGVESGSYYAPLVWTLTAGA